MRALDKSSDIASGKSIQISSLIDLIKRVAVLSFENKDHLLFYRGQRIDYLNFARNSSFYPTIYRTNKEKLPKELLGIRFKKLEQASDLLIKKLESREDIDASSRELKNRKYIRWSILQHYEVCETPLLDLTQSIKVASSFALLGGVEIGFFYVFALPYVTNRISINSEHDIVNIRLISICPPQALRPYFQEGCLVGTDDITTQYNDRTELDFKHRLVAKYELINTGNSFWGRQNSLEEYLTLPNDDFEILCDGIKKKIQEENNLELMFPGKWINEYVFSDGHKGEELVEIKNVNEYFIDGTHLFNLDSIFVDRENQIIEFRKVGIGDDKRKVFNSLKIVSENLYIGSEGRDTKISYKRHS